MERITIAFVEPHIEIGGSNRVLWKLVRGLDKDKFRPVLCWLYGLGQLGEQLQAEGYHIYHHLIQEKI